MLGYLSEALRLSKGWVRVLSAVVKKSFLGLFFFNDKKSSRTSLCFPFALSVCRKTEN